MMNVLTPPARSLRLLIVLVGLLFWAANSFGTGIEFEHMELKAAQEKAKAEGKLIFVDVYATWCGPCKYLSRETFPDKEVGEFFNANFVSLKVDGEKGEGPEMMYRFSLDAYPSLLILDADGNLVKKRAGAMDASSLLQWGRDGVSPEESAIFKLEKRFEAGERDKPFMIEYLQQLIEEEKDTEPLVSAYLAEYPEVELEDPNDFSIFYVGVNDLAHPALREYIANIERYHETYPDLSSDKLLTVLQYYLELSVKASDQRPMIDALDQIYPALKTVNGEEMPAYLEFKEYLVGIYEEMI